MYFSKLVAIPYKFDKYIFLLITEKMVLF